MEHIRHFLDRPELLLTQGEVFKILVKNDFAKAAAGLRGPPHHSRNGRGGPAFSNGGPTRRAEYGGGVDFFESTGPEGGAPGL